MIRGKLKAEAACAWLMVSPLAMLAVSSAVQAGTADLQQRHRFGIPSESLSAALTVFSAQSHMRVVTSGVPSDEISAAVTGDLSTRDAMTAILSGTGLSFRELDAKTIVVVPAAMAKLRPSQFQLVSDVSQDALADQPGATPAAAAAPAAGAPGPVVGTQLQEVTVSASAITIAGYEQPTPVTSVGIGQLQMAAQADITDVLRNLPAFTASASPQNSSGSNSISTGVAASDQVVLRNLGTLRTLVLVDSQRMNYGSLYGGVELSNIPQNLISRVDVVTAGASAVWGSDAVTGVVNYILNHNFNGVAINIADSNNQQNAHPKWNADITMGMPFDDGRGHIEASASFLRAPSVYYMHQLQGLAGQGTWTVENAACQGQTAASTGQPKTIYGWYCPAGQPWVTLASGDVGYATATGGGLIYNCLTAAGTGAGTVIPGCALRNIAFVGPNATPTRYDPGNITNTSSGNGGTTNIGAGGINPSWFGVVGAPQESTTAFALGSFRINEHVNVSVQLNYGYTSFYQDSYFTTQYGNSNPAILYSGNPYIPASIQSQMTAGGIGAFQIGTQNTNPLQGQPNIPLQSLIPTVGGVALFESRRLTRGVLTFDGDFGGSNWSWNAYYQRGESRQIEDGLNNAEIPLLKQAEDAVTVGSYSAHYTAAAYPNPLGIQAGTITCLSNLLPRASAGATSACAPLNILGSGPGVASTAAINYVQSVTRAGGNQNYSTVMENVYSGTVQGKLPFGLPAGPIALAVGAVYRNEDGVKVECGTPCEQVLFNVGNFAGFHGGYNVKEGSVELNAPILKDSFVKDLSVDAAWRGIDYSTSGFVQTYKFGLVSQLIDAVRLRASYSRDIRAGNLEEFFQPPATDGSSVVDLRTGQNVAEFTIHLGNATLLPEVGETRTAGLVFTPFQGFVSSVDWWYIHIKEAINDGLSGIAIENFCAAGVSSYCEDIVHGTYPVGSCIGPTLNSCGNQPIFGIISQAVNSDSEDTSGLDFLADYRMPFMDGALDFNTQDNYTFMLRYTTLGNTCDVLNSLSGDRNRYGGCNVGANPKFKGTTSVTYSQGAWLGTVGVRVIGASHYMNEWTSGVQIANNDIPAFFYVDLRASYNFGNGLQVYGALDNVGDRILPVQQGLAPSVQFGPNVLDQIYDGYGRVWHLGLRYRFGG